MQPELGVAFIIGLTAKIWWLVQGDACSSYTDTWELFHFGPACASSKNTPLAFAAQEKLIGNGSTDKWSS